MKLNPLSSFPLLVYRVLSSESMIDNLYSFKEDEKRASSIFGSKASLQALLLDPQELEYLTSFIGYI